MGRVAGFKYIVLVLVGTVTCLPSARAWAEASPFVGRWHYNKALSTLRPGEASASNLVAEISRVDSTHLRWSVTTRDSQGKDDVESFDIPANGEFYPISEDAAASFRVSGTTLQAMFKDQNGQSDAMTCTLSSNQAKMTCNGLITQVDGKTAKYVDVFDRT